MSFLNTIADKIIALSWFEMHPEDLDAARSHDGLVLRESGPSLTWGTPIEFETGVDAVVWIRDDDLVLWSGNLTDEWVERRHYDRWCWERKGFLVVTSVDGVADQMGRSEPLLDLGEAQQRLARADGALGPRIVEVTEVVSWRTLDES